MIGTALASLFGFSTAAWPPRLKMPTLYPVFPRLRVGMESEVAEFEGRGREGWADWPCTTSGRAADPIAAAVMIPPALRKARRLLLDGISDFALLISPPACGMHLRYRNCKSEPTLNSNRILGSNRCFSRGSSI